MANLNDDCLYYNDDDTATSEFVNEVTVVSDETLSLNLTRKSLSLNDLSEQAADFLVGTNVEATGSYSQENLLMSLEESNKMTKSSDLINRLAKPKRNYKIDQKQDDNEVVPLAEAVMKFNLRDARLMRNIPANLVGTIPHSPMLRTKTRNRPIYALSYEQLEEALLEESKRLQFKAQPLNKKIFEPPVHINKEPNVTEPEPFNLTLVQPKKAIPTSNEKSFHARPVPKSTYAMGTPFKLYKPIAKNTSQKSLQKETRKPTTPKPFSFEEREKMKEDKHKRILEQKNKMIETREFHARPVPKSVLHPSTKFTVKNTIKKPGKEELNTETRFKAKPAKVLHKKPFEPKKEHRPILETDSFILNTELRSKHRENFEQSLKKREENIKSLIRQEEELNKKKEEEEFLIARKKAEFKASNIKKYKEVVIEPIQQVTIPVTPQVLKRKDKINSEGKENVPF